MGEAIKLSQLKTSMQRVADTAVFHTAQELTDEQKAQARENIGVVSIGEVAVTFESVSQMKANTNLEAGQKVKTLGYYSSDDGGGAEYIIKESGNVGVYLDNELFAELCLNGANEINVRQLGAIASWSLNPASNYFSSLEELQKNFPLAQSLEDEMDLLAVELALSEYRTIYMPDGGYRFNRTLTVSTNQTLRGSSIRLTQISYVGTETPAINVTGNRAWIHDFSFTHSYTADAKGADCDITCIYAEATTHGNYENLYIVGFDYGINFGASAWNNTITHCSIQNCNAGIYAGANFNACVIKNCTFTYNDVCIYNIAGCGVVVEGCSFESSTVGVRREGTGNIIIRDNYFESLDTASIYIAWGMTPVDAVVIEGNRFYASSEDETFIMYHARATALIVIRNNTFRCGDITEGTTVTCLTPTNSTTTKPMVADNYLGDGCKLGITVAGMADYSRNGEHMAYAAAENFATAFTDRIRTVRTAFTDGGTITLPHYAADALDAYAVRKFMLYKSSPTGDDTEVMSIASQDGAGYIGTKQFKPNVIYSIYYNRYVAASGYYEYLICT